MNDYRERVLHLLTPEQRERLAEVEAQPDGRRTRNARPPTAEHWALKPKIVKKTKHWKN